jgi:hypothetical protein
MGQLHAKEFWLSVTEDKRFQIAAASVALCLLLVKSGWVLLSQADPVGFDGYYYVVQVDRLLHAGQLYYSTWTPLAFLIEAPFAFAVGNTVLGIKLATLFAVAVLFALAVKAGAAGNNSLWTSIFVASAIFMSSPFLYFEVEFLKNLFGLVFLFLAYVTFDEYIVVGRISSLVFGVLSIILAALSHKSTAGIGVVILLYFIVFNIAANRRRLSEFAAKLVERRLALAVGAALLLDGLLVAFRMDWHSPLRFINFLGGKNPALLVLPAAMTAVSVGVLALPVDFNLKSAATIEQYRFGVTLVLAAVTLAFCFVTVLNLTQSWNDLIDRMCLAFYPFGAILGSRVLRSDPRGLAHAATWVASTLIILILSLPTAPPGLDFSRGYKLIQADQHLLRTTIAEDSTILAPHGVDLLLTSRYGLKATHLRENIKEADVLQFMWKAKYIQRRLQACGYEYVDLGGGTLIHEQTLEKIASQEIAPEGPTSAPRIPSEEITQAETQIHSTHSGCQ